MQLYCLLSRMSQQLLQLALHAQVVPSADVWPAWAVAAAAAADGMMQASQQASLMQKAAAATQSCSDHCLLQKVAAAAAAAAAALAAGPLLYSPQQGVLPQADFDAAAAAATRTELASRLFEPASWPT